MVSNCVTQNDLDYYDNIARQKFFPLAAAAYSSSPQDCITNKFKNASMVASVTVSCEPEPCASCAGFTAVLHEDKAIVLSFRGTSTLVQLIKESVQTVFHAKIKWIAGGYVSKYFYNAFNAVWSGGMKENFENILKTYPSYGVWVTGHSLGGAMASLAASYVVSKGYVNAANIKLVTFGQPRTGDSDFALATNTKLNYSFRIVHRRDIIPHLPSTYKNYKHHDVEVFYPNQMGDGARFRICHGGESSGCSNGLLHSLSFHDHRHYFNLAVSSYGVNGCVESSSFNLLQWIRSKICFWL